MNQQKYEALGAAAKSLAEQGYINDALRMGHTLLNEDLSAWNSNTHDGIDVWCETFIYPAIEVHFEKAGLDIQEELEAIYQTNPENWPDFDSMIKVTA